MELLAITFHHLWTHNCASDVCVVVSHHSRLVAARVCMEGQGEDVCVYWGQGEDVCVSWGEGEGESAVRCEPSHLMNQLIV